MMGHIGKHTRNTLSSTAKAPADNPSKSGNTDVVVVVICIHDNQGATSVSVTGILAHL